MDFGKTIKLGGNSTSWVQFPVFLVTESSSLFYVLECLYKFVFDFGGGFCVESSVGVGILQKCQSFVDVVWFIHDNYGLPLVHNEYHP